MNLNDSVTHIPSIGDLMAKRLSKLEISTIRDLLFHFPNRHEDLTTVSTIRELQPLQTTTLRVKINKIENVYTKYRKNFIKAQVEDDTGKITVIWYNQPYLTQNIKPEEIYYLSGKLGSFSNKPALISPKYEREKGEQIHTKRLVPIYPETYGVTSKWLREKIKFVLDHWIIFVPETLPDKLLVNNLPSLKNALLEIHFPTNFNRLQKAKERLAFEELFTLQLNILNQKQTWVQKRRSKPLVIDKKMLLEFIMQLPFKLTQAQKRSIDQITLDLIKDTAMNRLLQGDVGSGKTIVAAICTYLNFLNGYKTIFLAPTEILAFQHYQTIKNLFLKHKINVGLVTKSSKEIQADVLIGTHALLNVETQKLIPANLIIIDEQHKFGVEQRQKLLVDLNKLQNFTPHILSMTATPIPRTLALTFYGNLEISTIDELPAGRKKEKTFIVPKKKRNDAYKFIGKKVELGQQAFIICPLIELSETLATVKSAKDEYDKLSKETFPNLSLGLLHGRLKSKEKNQILEDLQNNKINILVATPIVEAGIDLPQATIILIETAERLGLA